jgi:hypothetical protein
MKIPPPTVAIGMLPALVRSRTIRGWRFAGSSACGAVHSSIRS